MTEAEVLRPGPVIGTGQRVLALQRATLASRLGSFATVAAALFRGLSKPDVDPGRLLSQRSRARHLAQLITEIETVDESASYETSELVPRRLWRNITESLQLTSDLGVNLNKILDDVDHGDINRTEMQTQAAVFARLAQQLREAGRGSLGEAANTGKKSHSQA